MKYQIFIPSKDRANDCATAELLKKEGVPFTLVVEPQNYKVYSEKYDDVIQLDKNDQGLSYARNWIKDHAKDNYHWQMDDDIVSFQERNKGKNRKTDALRLIEYIENDVSQYTNVAIAGFRDVVYAWTQKEFRSVNKVVASAFLVKKNTPMKFPKGVIEDLSYLLESLQEGYCSIIYNRYLYQKKPNNRASGGQQNFSYIELQKGTQKRYPRLLSIIENKNGSYTLRTNRNVKKFIQYPLKDVSNT